MTRYFRNIAWDLDGDGDYDVDGNLAIASPYKIFQGTSPAETHARNVKGYSGLFEMFQLDTDESVIEFITDTLRFGTKTDHALEIIQNNSAIIQISAGGVVNITTSLTVDGVPISGGGGNSSIGDDTPGEFTLGRYNGTEGTPTQVLTGEEIGSLIVTAETDVDTMVEVGKIRFNANTDINAADTAVLMHLDLGRAGGTMFPSALIVGLSVEYTTEIFMTSLRDYIIYGAGVVGGILGSGATKIIEWDDTGLNLGFYGVSPIARPLLATGGGATVDNVITVLQNLGLVRQS